MNDPSPSRLLCALEYLYTLGSEICKEIERFRPDVVLGLLHSGWAPVVAAQTVWVAATRCQPFPPVARSNIGQEKHAVYLAGSPHRLPYFCCEECSEEEEIGHLLAWLDRKDDWVSVLRSQVLAAPGLEAPPERILLVDDVKGGGKTTYISLGLCELAFPGAQALLAAGSQDWTNDFTAAWLEQFAPALYETVREKVAVYNETHSRARYPDDLFCRIKPLITGTQDRAPDLLEWDTLNEDSPAVLATAGFLSPFQALSASAWTDQTIIQYARSRASGSPPPPGTEPVAEKFYLHTRELDADVLLMRQAWRPGGLSFGQIRQIGGFSRPQARAWLQRGLEYRLIPQGFGRATTYLPANVLPDWEDRAALEFYFVEPGQLAIGEYPYDVRQHEDYTGRKETGLAEILQDLLARGFTAFMDLTAPDEASHFPPYGETLRSLRLPDGRPPAYLPLPLKRHVPPDRDQLLIILERLNALNASGEQVYLHSRGCSPGRAVLVAAAWLLQRGGAPAEALAEIERQSQGTRLMRWPRKPDNEAQYRWLMKWKG